MKIIIVFFFFFFFFRNEFAFGLKWRFQCATRLAFPFLNVAGGRLSSIAIELNLARREYVPQG